MSTPAPINRQWLLARTPPGPMPVAQDFRLVEAPIPEPGPGQILARAIYLSMDPYQWLRRRTGVERPGDVCHGRAVSQVVASRMPGLAEGDFVFNPGGWQSHALAGANTDVFGYMHLRRIDPAQAPISTAVGVLGMLGLTAYAGVRVQCQPRSGETLVVSAASGGVGQIAGQIGRILGCRVVGIAGAQDKCDFVTGVLGFDACVSYKRADFPDALRAACPEGIDVYFENVGGAVFEAVLPLLNRGARISLCGLLANYGDDLGEDIQEAWMRRGQPVFERRQVRASKLHVGNFVDRWQAPFLETMAGWIRDGRVKYRESLWRGIEQAPEAFRAMLNGENFGKTLVQIGADPTLDAATAARRAGGNVLGD
ncbi:MAG: NADP-dependent oxidoreductase [Gammaproteobacteria bacterium]